MASCPSAHQHFFAAVPFPPAVYYMGGHGFGNKMSRFRGTTIDGVLIDWLITYTHHSELQVIPHHSYLHSLQITTENIRSSPAWSVFTRRFMATDLNSGDSSASRAEVLPVRSISRNWTLSQPVKVILRLAAYRQSVRLADKPLQTHDQRLFFKRGLEEIVLT
jgi:hypothetical protein